MCKKVVHPHCGCATTHHLGLLILYDSPFTLLLSYNDSSVTFSHACDEFRVDNTKKTEVIGQDVNSTPSISISKQILDVVEDFIYLGSTISSSLSLDNELNTRVNKVLTT